MLAKYYCIDLQSGECFYTYNQEVAFSKAIDEYWLVINASDERIIGIETSTDIEEYE